MARRSRPRAAPGDPTGYTLRLLANSVDAWNAAGEGVEDAILGCRAVGHSWRAIGQVLGVTGEAIRKAYGPRVDELLRRNGMQLEPEDQEGEPAGG